VGWYFVTKTINGRRYRYRQRTWREGGKVRTENHYLGPETLPMGGGMGDTAQNMLTPQLDILPVAQRQLWAELNTTPEHFALYGGTALALRLGHRVSVDFDFFSPNTFKPADLRARVPYLAGGQTIQEEPNTLTMNLERGGPVQVSFFGLPTLGQIEPHEIVKGPGVKVASLLDLSGMKAAVVYQRAEPKDYLDIHALLTQAKIPLPVMLAAAKAIYGEEFNPLISLKAISYHGDETLAALPDSLRRDLIAAVRLVDLDALPELTPIKPRGGAR
jgi:Nucleotidyl transferase AbiEii toxin, Type IV TA system